MAIMVLKFIGTMYLSVPVKMDRTMMLFALSDGWKASQNTYSSLFGQMLDIGVQSPIPLYGPCPQHATFDVINPVSVQFSSPQAQTNQMLWIANRAYKVFVKMFWEVRRGYRRPADCG